jgi:membrane protein
VALRHLVSWFDRLQRRRSVFGFPLAVWLKYAEDHGSYLGAIVTYYAFLSLFPLLLVAATVLGFVLQGHAALQRSVGESVLGTFPIVGHDLRVHALTGNGVALGVGLTLSLWAGNRVFIAAGSVMDQIWGIPPRGRPGFVAARLRALLVGLVLGSGAVGTSVLNAFGTVGPGHGLLWRIGSFALSTAANVALFWLVFRLLTADEVSWRQLRGGAVLAAFAWELLVAGGSLYVHYVVASASNTYGTFATVIGLLSFIYLSVHITLLAAETNVVATRRLWPRSLPFAGGGPTTDGDRTALDLREAAVGGEPPASAVAFGSRSAPAVGEQEKEMRQVARRCRTMRE